MSDATGLYGERGARIALRVIKDRTNTPPRAPGWLRNLRQTIWPMLSPASLAAGRASVAAADPWVFGFRLTPLLDHS
jgi:hypothetical protein